MPDENQLNEQQIELPVIYFNGFQIGVTNSDLSGILLLNGHPTMAVSMSYTTAKTLQAALAEVMEGLEASTGQRIMTTKEIEAGMERAGATRGRAKL